MNKKNNVLIVKNGDNMKEEEIQAWMNQCMLDVKEALPYLFPPVTWAFEEHEHVETPRGFAGTWLSRRPSLQAHIGLSRKCLSVSRDRLLGILRHEFGHVVDFTVDREALDQFTEHALAQTKERRADDIARFIWKSPIYYDRDLWVQTISNNKKKAVHPRPKHLGL